MKSRSIRRGHDMGHRALPGVPPIIVALAGVRNAFLQYVDCRWGLEDKVGWARLSRIGLGWAGLGWGWVGVLAARLGWAGWRGPKRASGRSCEIMVRIEEISMDRRSFSMAWQDRWARLAGVAGQSARASRRCRPGPVENWWGKCKSDGANWWGKLMGQIDFVWFYVMSNLPHQFAPSKFQNSWYKNNMNIYYFILRNVKIWWGKSMGQIAHVIKPNKINLP